jgi:hypothetical protein
MTKAVFSKFPSIEQFRNVVQNVSARSNYVGKDENGEAIYDHTREKPTITFIETIKIHGTNAGFTLTKTGEVAAQSRSRLLSLESDNNGFYAWVMNPERKEELINSISNFINFDKVKQATVFGEFAGESIQKGVAVSQLPKSFYVFSVQVMYDDETVEWLPIDTIKFFENKELNIFNLLMFPTRTIDIDFNNPENYVNDLVDRATRIGDSCLVGEYFGINDKTGEGVVLRSINSPDGHTYLFKVKDDRHSNSKVAKLSKVDQIAIKNVKEFVDNVVTENRLEQGLQWIQNEMMLPLEMKSIGAYIKWVTEDTVKEEKDIIIEKQLNFAKVKKEIGNVARKFYIQRINTNL